MAVTVKKPLQTVLRTISSDNRRMDSLFNELKRRNVLRLAAAYALVAWILIEAGSVLLPTFGVAEWFFRAYLQKRLGKASETPG